MIKWLIKYGAPLFIFNTFLLSIPFTISFGNMLFLFIMASSCLFILYNPKQIKYVIMHKSFRFFLFLNIINFIYWLFFHDFKFDLASKYLLARFMQFTVISFSVYYNLEYFKNNFLNHMSYIILFLIIIGLAIDFNIFAGRYSGIFWNPNALSSFSVVGFASVLLNHTKRSYFDYFLLFIFLIISLSTGSRSVLFAIPLVFLFRYGISLRNILFAFFAILVYLSILNIQLDTSINRFASQSLFNDRFLQYYYAFETLKNSPIIGFGLDKYSYIDQEVVPSSLAGSLVTAHNGYLAILVQLGLIFGSIVIAIILYVSLSFFIVSTDKDLWQRFYLYIILYVLIGALFESFFTGINEFQTILFWLSLAVLSFSKFIKQNAI